MRPSLTIRGWTVVAVVLVAVAMSQWFGPRALNAVVVPLGVVLLAGLAAVVRADRPYVDRHPVPDGFIGEHRRVEVAIESGGPIAATVRDTVGEGLSATEGPIAETTLEGDETVAYDVQLERRGDNRVGPLSIVVQDILGLVERPFEYEEITPALVYPYVRDLGRGSATDLQALTGLADRHDQREFDYLREYRHGDSLRDVHWKSAAKRPGDQLTVVEYADDENGSAVTVAAECLPHGFDGATDRGSTDRVDEMAAAAASVVTYLLERGTTVGIALPNESRPPGAGRTHHRELLRLLALAEPGELPERTRRDADVLVRTEADETTIVVEGREIPFDRLRGSDRSEEARRAHRELTGRDDGNDRGTGSSPRTTT